MSDDLVERLREFASPVAEALSDGYRLTKMCHQAHEAADRIQELESKLVKAMDALVFVESKISWEINPSNYDHDQVCDMNSDWCEIGNYVETTLAELK